MDKFLREKIYWKFKGCCSYCGEKILYKSMQVDHMIPQSNYNYDISDDRIKDLRIPNFLKHLTEGDVNHIDNLYPSCRKCNNFKSSFTLEIFREQLEEQLQRAIKTSSNFRRALQYNQVKLTPQPIVFHFETMIKDPKQYTVNMKNDSILEDELFEFLYWYQRAPLDNKNQAEIVDIYLKDVRKND